MKKFNSLCKLIGFITLFLMSTSAWAQKQGITSIDTDYTITHVRNANFKKKNYIVANSYEGRILIFDAKGKKLWDHPLSGYANHDLWCDDINNDGNDEILAANADGHLYVLNHKGDLLWKYKAEETPLLSVTAMNGAEGKYIVIGGMDRYLYYLSPKGKLIQTIFADDYSLEKPRTKMKDKRIPSSTSHVANFLRPAKYTNGEEILVVHGMHNQNNSTGSIYLFKADATTPFKKFSLGTKGTVGDLRVVDANNDGVNELSLGSSGMLEKGQITEVNLESKEVISHSFRKNFRKELKNYGYRVAQTDLVLLGKESKFFTLVGNNIILQDAKYNTQTAEVLQTKYAYNNMWKDTSTGNIILASAQSGGSCIHILHLDNPSWEKGYKNLEPKGKLSKLLKNTADFRSTIQSFEKPKWEGKGQDVFFMTEKITDGNEEIIGKLKKQNRSPYFLKSQHMPKVENWDRTDFGNKVYTEKRDRRKTYSLSQQDVLDILVPNYKNEYGISYWGGHGNDPMMISLETEKKILDAGGDKKTVMIFPELEHYDQNFAYVMDNFLYPLADYAKGKNANIYVRTKHAFWHSIIYLPMWNGLVSGEYSSIFVPSMEETTDKSMDLSYSGKMGIWASGATDSWGARAARDNTSYYRQRQFSSQTVPNHMLRMMVYNIASGAQYLNNFHVDQKYFSVLYEMVDKGVIYVPKKSEIVSFNPVHLSMTTPDKDFLDEGNNVKWTTFYDKEREDNRKMVFSRLNGSWPAAPVTAYDFSAYASGSKERRLDFLPKFENGMVLITPPQSGVYADKKASRGKLEDHLHPLYKNITKEFITNGKDYLSADGKQTFAADTYYKNVEKAIQEGSKQIPINVSGDVAWVAVQTAPNHIRLTLVDNGYINPDDRKAKITFNSIEVKGVKDVVSKEEIDYSDKNMEVEIPCGLFRFLDIELSVPL
ncbi:hypothetical protein MY04_4268 [Flammeovirga sp. MY04]|uniref:hypothetical protein n=1 Tax=Flammeovirga sp. MY04 TaxID=1191459 RepID=UPI0008062D4E|nr:hypothetical protein [Flammeovirga sp. MY04]ANQ51610.1 hypothetical protein MY04_4268 [Flammeovirga sp. MY04]